MQLFVLGMHRSGTSAVTRILNMAGAYFGPEGISNGADEGNPKGFWERVDVRAACDGLLRDAGFDWWRVSGFSLDRISETSRTRNLTELRKTLLELDAHRPWVVKEPRLSLLFPLVRPLLEVPVCVHVYREPLEVAESLRTRNGFPLPVGLALWEVYSARVLRSVHRTAAVLVRYEDLVADPRGGVRDLLERLGALGVQGLHVPTEQEITAFVTPELHRQRRSGARRGEWLNQAQAALAAAIEDGSVLTADAPHTVSEGAIAELEAFEEPRDVEALEKELAEVRERGRGHRGAGPRHGGGLGRARQDDRRRQRGANDALRKLDAGSQALSHTRTWRLVWRLQDIRAGLERSGRGQRWDPIARWGSTSLRRVQPSRIRRVRRTRRLSIDHRSSPQMQLVVLGTHRSETSTLVRLLARSGAFVVDEDRSQDAGESPELGWKLLEILAERLRAAESR